MSQTSEYVRQQHHALVESREKKPLPGRKAIDFVRQLQLETFSMSKQQLIYFIKNISSDKCQN